MTQFLDLDNRTEDQSLKVLAQNLLNVGLIPIPCIVTWDSSASKYKKIIGYRNQDGYQEVTKKLDRLNIESVSDHIDQWFSDATRGLGVVCCKDHRVDKWLVKIDFDEGNEDIKDQFFRAFYGDEVAIFSTVSGGLGVLCWVTEYIPNGTKIYFNDALIGNTSDFNVIPPSEGYAWLQERRWDDLKVYTLNELRIRGIHFGEIKNVEIPRDCVRYASGLELLELAYNLEVYGDRDLDRQWRVYGYSDSYDQWLDVLLIGRSIASDYPGFSAWLLDAFTEFSERVGRNSGSWNDATRGLIDEEWCREDKGGLGIATLEQWVKGIWNNGKIQPKLNKDQIVQWKEWIGETVRGRIDAEGWFSVFKKAYQYSKVHKHLEIQTLLDGCVQFGVELKQFVASYEQFKQFELASATRGNNIPSWEISDHEIGDILNRLPVGNRVYRYATDRGLNPALFLPLYLATALCGVSKRYRRLSMNGHSIHGAINVFLIGESGDGKSLYTRIVDCLVDQQRIYDRNHQNELKMWEWCKKESKKKGSEIEVPDEPIHKQIRISNFTYSALLDAQANNNCGVSIVLDEASTQFSTDVSGMKMGTATILANYCKVWNGDCESERRRGRGVSYSIQVKASMVAGLQTKWLKEFLKSDDNGFFARSHLIMMHPVEEKDSEITSEELKRDLAQFFTQVLNYFERLDLPGNDNLWAEIIGTKYPFSTRVEEYLKDVYEIGNKRLGKRQQYLNKVRENFWRIVQALECIYTVVGVELDWEKIYAESITISKWLTDCYEEAITSVSCYRINQHEDISDPRALFEADTVKFYSNPNHWGQPGFEWVRRAKKRTVYKELDNKLLYSWLEELLSLGKIKTESKGYKVCE